VALRQHGDHHPFKKAVLADDDALDLVEYLLHQLGGVARRGAGVHGLPFGW